MPPAKVVAGMLRNEAGFKVLDYQDCASDGATSIVNHPAAEVG
jgi:hypothetical protein